MAVGFLPDCVPELIELLGTCGIISVTEGRDRGSIEDEFPRGEPRGPTSIDDCRHIIVHATTVSGNIATPGKVFPDLPLDVVHEMAHIDGTPAREIRSSELAPELCGSIHGFAASFGHSF